jgi:hypothetical protein
MTHIDICTCRAHSRALHFASSYKYQPSYMMTSASGSVCARANIHGIRKAYSAKSHDFLFLVLLLITLLKLFLGDSAGDGRNLPLFLGPRVEQHQARILIVQPFHHIIQADSRHTKFGGAQAVDYALQLLLFGLHVQTYDSVRFFPQTQTQFNYYYGASGASPTGRCSDGRADGQSDAKEIEIQSKINKRNKISFYILRFLMKQRVVSVRSSRLCGGGRSMRSMPSMRDDFLYKGASRVAIRKRSLLC